MAHYAPEEAFDVLKDRLTETVQSHFPLEGKKHVLVAKKVWVDDNKDVDDIKSQKEAKLKERTWSVPVRAELELRDKATGKVVDRQAVNIAQLPKITRRYTYITGGNEYQVNNQFRLKSGVYTHVKENGELASQWNLAKGLNFNMDFDPKSKKMTLNFSGSGSNIGLYPVLKTMGVDDDTIERKWGKEVLNANRKSKPEVELRKFYKAFKGENPKSLDEARAFIREEFSKTQLRPDSTKLTLGKEFKEVDGSALLTGSNRILEVARGEADPDDRDSLQFKDLWSAEDLLTYRMDKKDKWSIKRKMTNNVDKQTKIKSIIHPEIFGRPIKQFFTQSTLTERPDQMNPMSYIAGNRRTTIRGEGGIQKEHAVTPSAKAINPSHLGFLDPIQTPESSKIGTTLQLALSARKKGNSLEIPVLSTKTGKTEWIDPGTAMRSNLAYADQFKKVDGKMKAVGSTVKVSDPEGRTVMTDAKNVDYVMKSSKGMFDLSANLIPFLQNDQGNRAMMGAKQLEQAVALTTREAPLVQSKSEGKHTFEDIVGRFSSHMAPVDGQVMQVKKDGIILRDDKGKRHEVQLYDDFPMNDDKSVLNSNAIVKKGDKVVAGQVIADSNFTKDGTLALGTNLRIAYMPYEGYNYDDGIVISEDAAKKLTSEHMFRNQISQEKNIILNKKKFLAHTAGRITKSQAAKLDDTGVIAVGQKVEPGDVIIGALKQEEVTPEKQQVGLFSKKLIKPIRPKITTWEKDHPGTVTQVVKHGKKTTVYVRSDAPADIGDKIVGRHGNKGIVTSILPQNEMPVDKEGKAVDVLLNPATIPSRINVGQVLETAASKIAKKTGKPYVINNFDPNIDDYTRHLQAELKKHGLKDTEEIFDPRSGKKMGEVLTGDQYIYKLHHTAAKGLSVRSRDAYDSNMVPRKGGPAGGQTMDAMGLYSMLAHNARENVREMQTYKSDWNDDFWALLQAGDSVPTPKTPFVWKKFEGYMKGLGLDVHKQGNDLILQPLTDKKVLQMSNGEIKDPGASLVGRNLKPEKDGIFDTKVTGTKGIGPGELGNKWAHITLAERMPNPIFEKPVRALLGLSQRDYDDIINSKKDFEGKKGPAAIVGALKKIDVKKEASELEAQLPTLRTTRLNKANKKLKYLNALQKAGMGATDAYTMKHMPVLPATMRPVSVLDNGNVNFDDVNKHYNMMGTLNSALKKFDPEVKPEEEAFPLRGELYEGIKAMMLTGAMHKGRHANSIAGIISGKKQPKEGFFQAKVIGRRQDLSMRSTIVPEPSMGLDEVGIPRKAAMELYKPFVVRRMTQMGAKLSPLRAQEEIRNGSTLSQKALEHVVSERPLLLKRDPVLHKYGVQAFKPQLTEGKVIKIHPLATSGYNADFDGDKMSAFVPVSQKAVKEAHKMLPSNNLFSPSTGFLMFKPTQESMLGLYKLTEMKKGKAQKFKDTAAVAKAVKEGSITMNDLITVEKQGGDLLSKLAASGQTTVGRMLVYQTLPKEMQKKSDHVLHDPKFELNKDNLQDLLTEVALKHNADFGKTADKLKDLGNQNATGLSISLKDFESDRVYRDKVLAIATKEEMKIRQSPRMSKRQKEEKAIELYQKAGDLINKKAKTRADASSNRMYDWTRSGAKGKWDQFRQMTVAPVLVADSKGRPVPVPIGKSYSEGLDIGSYWTSLHGARMGTISRVEGTWRPGLMGKQIMQTTMDQVVVDEDCKTNKGIKFSIDDRNLLDRYTVGDVHLGKKGGKDKGKIPSGTLLTPELINRLKNNKIQDIRVRSPLKCAHGKGMCAKCYGLNEDGQLHAPGTNVGIIAAHSLGEPATQLSMNAFHTGGVVGAKGTQAVSTFDRLDQLMKLPKTLPGSATLATSEGKVEKIEKDPAGGWNVFVKGQRHFVRGTKDLKVKKGSSVRKGDALSTGPKNPREMLSLTGLNSVQSYLTNEIQDVYKNEAPLSRRNTETFVRAMTNLAEVTDPGEHPTYLRGDKVPASEVSSFNGAQGPEKKAVQYRPVLSGVEMLPLDLQEDWVARLQSRELRNTVIDAAAEGWRTTLHSTHPIPGMAYGKEFGLGKPDVPGGY
jgi:DNA-directed RNA polymerase subunit beta'